ncbi:MAG: gamma-glutamyltransferase [Bdellovibrionaceae bacterium]|nr:gamma-glutamyltransferase [Pseudobdellovibrionaceae bacterium]
MLKNFTLILLIVLFILTSQLIAQAIPVEGKKMLISAPSPYAVEAGKKIIKKGGNVVDVATVVGLTLAVTNPYFAAFGGGGFAMVKVGNNPVDVLDFRETAPLKTHPQYYLDKKPEASQNGGTAVAVPGVAAGIYELHKKYGKLSWKELFSEPIQLAEDGFNVSGEWTARTEISVSRFNPKGAQHFLKNQKAYQAGELLKQKPLSSFLKMYKRQGPKAFYTGPVANDIVKTVKDTGGDLSLQDLNDYKVRWLKPLTHNFKGYVVYLMPPPSSGGVVLKTALSLIDQLKLENLESMSVDELHLMGEILNRSFRGRALLGDPDFHENPLEKLLSKNYIGDMAKSINLTKAKQLKPLSDKNLNESNETTHYSILDDQGNSVSITVTLNGNYGSAVVSEKFGIALNNEMDDFTTHPGEANMYGLVQGKGNYVQARKRPLSSMSPTLVEKDGKVILSLGAPGGPTIISGVLQVIYNSLVRNMDIDRAIQSPRVHHQFLPNVLYIDEWRLQPATKKGLLTKGHVLEEKAFIGRVNAVRLKNNGALEAAFDSRGEGAVGGY